MQSYKIKYVLKINFKSSLKAQVVLIKILLLCSYDIDQSRAGPNL